MESQTLTCYSLYNSDDDYGPFTDRNFYY